MSVKMQPTSEIKIHLGIDVNGRVQKLFTNTCYKRMDKYVPKKEKILRETVNKKPSSIIYETNYARYQYYGVRDDGTHKVTHYTTPGTGPYWDKRMWSAEKDIIISEVQKYIRRKK